MATEVSPRRRLTAAMDKRRIELRMQWSDVAAHADMSVAHLRRIRNDEVPVTPLAAANLETALRWAAGSVEEVLRGGSPRPLGPVMPETHVEVQTPAGREGAVVISAGGSTTAISIHPDEPEPDPDKLFDPALDQYEEMIWAMRRRPWPARRAAILAMRAGIEEAQRIESESSWRVQDADPDIGRASEG